MPKISEERRQQQRQRIIDAAVSVLLRRGFAGTSMVEIISASGMSAGAIYGYFPGKEDLFQAAARQVLGQRMRVLEGIDGRKVPPPSEALMGFFRELQEGNAGSKMIVQMWGQSVSDEGMRKIARQVFTEGHAAVEKYLVAWYRQEGVAEAESLGRGAAGAVLALAQGAVLQSALLGKPLFDLEENLLEVLT